MRRERPIHGLRMAEATLSILLCVLLAGCATDAPHAVSAPRDLAGTKLEFADLHSANASPTSRQPPVR